MTVRLQAYQINGTAFNKEFGWTLPQCSVPDCGQLAHFIWGGPDKTITVGPKEWRVAMLCAGHFAEVRDEIRN